MIKKVELLAPAGNLEKAKIALLYGADAVYVGGEVFSLRARASNFSLDDLKTLVEFAHQKQRKVYVTMNIIPHDDDFNQIERYLHYLESIHIDAIIVTSLGIIQLVKKITPKIAIHISTQTSTTNHLAVEFWANNFAERVVLARELSISEISDVMNNTKTEIEVFIHGGMCAGFSGRCVLSNHMSDRDANRGGCAHSCRWNYQINNETNKPIFGFASKDLMAIDYLSDLIHLNVTSLKIEGRMKSSYYLACVVKTYRTLIDLIYTNGNLTNENIIWGKKEIAKAENRATCSGFLAGLPDETCELFTDIVELPTKDYLGIVLSYDSKNQIAVIEQRNYFQKNDVVEFFGPMLENITFIIDNIMDDSSKMMIDIVPKPLMKVQIKLPFEVHPNDMMRKCRSN